MQLHVFTGAADLKPVAAALERSGIEAALYADLNDPRGMGLLAMHEDPGFFATRLRELLAEEPFAGLGHRPELTMLGRTYASGFEPDLDDWLLRRPRRTALNPAWPWAIWYPLRRVGAFARLSRPEQGAILREHAARSGGHTATPTSPTTSGSLATVSTSTTTTSSSAWWAATLHPLSHLIQTMRGTAQTSQYVQTLGPFFVGHVVWQSPLR